jgi:hypothetical protein
MLLRLFNVLLGVLGIVEGRSRVRVDLDEIGTLLVHLGIDLLRNVVDICHELLHVVQLLLPLLDDVLHVGGLALNLELLNVELLLLEEVLVVPMVLQARRTLVVHERLAPFDQIQMLLHLQVDLLLLLLELVDDLGQPLVVRLLLFLLLALGAVGHGDFTVVVDLRAQVLRLALHLLTLRVHFLPQVVVVPLRANVLLELDEVAQVVLELGQLTLNLDVLVAQGVREQRLLLSWLGLFASGGIVGH